MAEQRKYMESDNDQKAQMVADKAAAEVELLKATHATEKATLEKELESRVSRRVAEVEQTLGMQLDSLKEENARWVVCVWVWNAQI